jgi:CubicO group peptidase (beta-lactamase class C family)
LGFSLLGEALRAQTDISNPDLIAQRITGPLGMRDTAMVAGRPARISLSRGAQELRDLFQNP